MLLRARLYPLILNVSQGFRLYRVVRSLLSKQQILDVFALLCYQPRRYLSYHVVPVFNSGRVNWSGPFSIVEAKFIERPW